MSILERIHGHEDLALLNDADRESLCAEIRRFLVSNVAKTGGHLASNLGVVELSVAIETVFNTMEDRLVFDVGHQSYVHKLLTGRQADFAHLRQFGGMSGFPKPEESPSDAFVAGHASSSVSIALGMARARTLLGESYRVVACIGDGAATGGMAYEALNDAAVSKEPLVVILNDNAMSIDKNVGGLSRHLSRMRTQEYYLDMKRWYRSALSCVPGGQAVYRFTKRIKDRVKRIFLPSTIFENMGMAYLGPVDGHDLPQLIHVLQIAQELSVPVLVHVKTRKGYGYLPAQLDPAKFHGIGKFNPESGIPLSTPGPTFSSSFGEAMMELAEKNPRVCAITAAMPSGTGLAAFKKKFPQRLFDVGIAEEHAVSMAGGLAKQGMIPVVALYSTFLQRGYDQILQDVGLLGLHVVFAIDRAGLVGDDGPTHHGVFDVGFLRQVPGMLILSPASLAEQKQMLRWAVEDYDGPVAIRYPRGGEAGYGESCWKPVPQLWKRGLSAVHGQGTDITLVTYGTMIAQALKAAELLAEQGIHASVVRLLTLSALSTEEILACGRGPVMVVEETASGSGIYEALSCQLRSEQPDCQVHHIDLGHRFIPHGSQNKLYEFSGLDAASIARYAKEVLSS